MSPSLLLKTLYICSDSFTLHLTYLLCSFASLLSPPPQKTTTTTTCRHRSVVSLSLLYTFHPVNILSLFCVYKNSCINVYTSVYSSERPQLARRIYTYITYLLTFQEAMRELRCFSLTAFVSLLPRCYYFWSFLHAASSSSFSMHVILYDGGKEGLRGTHKICFLTFSFYLYKSAAIQSYLSFAHTSTIFSSSSSSLHWVMTDAYHCLLYIFGFLCVSYLLLLRFEYFMRFSSIEALRYRFWLRMKLQHLPTIYSRACYVNPFFVL